MPARALPKQTGCLITHLAARAVFGNVTDPASAIRLAGGSLIDLHIETTTDFPNWVRPARA